MTTTAANLVAYRQHVSRAYRLQGAVLLMAHRYGAAERGYMRAIQVEEVSARDDYAHGRDRSIQSWFFTCQRRYKALTRLSLALAQMAIDGAEEH